MNGAIQWGDLSPIFAALAFIVGALRFLWSRIDSIRAAGERKIEAAREQTLARVEAVRADLTERVELLRDEIVIVRLEMAHEVVGKTGTYRNRPALSDAGLSQLPAARHCTTR
ncbi:hypothetical protein [Labrys neptuniae]